MNQELYSLIESQDPKMTITFNGTIVRERITISISHKRTEEGVERTIIKKSTFEDIDPENKILLYIKHNRYYLIIYLGKFALRFLSVSNWSIEDDVIHLTAMWNGNEMNLHILEAKNVNTESIRISKS
jgi:hypothetical protein